MKIKKVNIFGLVLSLTIISSMLPVQSAVIKSKQLIKIPNTLQYVQQELLVQYKNGQSGSTLLSQNRLMSLSSQSIGKSKNNEHFSVIKIKKDINLQSAMEKLKADPGVKAVSYNYVRQFHFSPNDPSYSGKVNEMWSLHDTAPDLTAFLGPVDPAYPFAPNSADKVIGNDINAEKAWDIWNKVSSDDKAKVIVAVIDTGVDYTHPDLIDAMWDGSKATINKVPSPTKNHGYDTADGDDDPYPISFMHGTHVAGTIAATTNNGVGIPGIASGIKIMAIKVSKDLFVSSADSAVIAGINYAVENGADIINLSLGSETPENKVYTEAVKNAVEQDVLLVISAGNSKNDNDITKTNAKGEKLNVWPAQYATLDSTKAGVISVAATDQADLLWEHSSFGANSVNIGAPGVNIKSTVTGIEIKAENIASGSQIPYNPDPAIASPFTGDGNYPLCSVSPTTCFDNTFFSNTSGLDCVGPACQWGWIRLKQDPGFIIAGDSQASSTTGYASSIDGTITTKVINVSSSKKTILSFTVQWDLECDSDYVDIEVFDGTNWVLLAGNNNELNTNETVSGACLQKATTTRSQHTLTGRMAEYSKKMNPENLDPRKIFNYDISAYNNPKLQVRFHFVTNAAINSTLVPSGVMLMNVQIQTQVDDYSKSYAYGSGTSMSAPHIVGIAALIKGVYPDYTGAEIKTALIKGGDINKSLAGKTSSGKRANAYNPIAGTTTKQKTTTSKKSSGGCSIKLSAGFDPLFPVLLLLSLFYWIRQYTKRI